MSKINGILMLLIYICVVTAMLNNVFVESNNLSNVVRRIALFGIIGIGVAFVIMTGGIDLSIGSLIGLVGCVIAMLLQVKYEPLEPALIANLQEGSARVEFATDKARYGPGDLVAVYDGKASNQGIFAVDSSLGGIERPDDAEESGATASRYEAMEFTEPLPANDRQGKLIKVHKIDAVDREYYDFIVKELPVQIEGRDRLLFFATDFQRAQEVTVTQVISDSDGFHIELDELPDGFDDGGHFAVIKRRANSVAVSVMIVMGMSLGIGLIHGLLITKVHLQPFVVTLCGLLIYRGVARTITGDQYVGFGDEYDQSLRMVALGTPCSIATLLLIAGVVVMLIGLVRVVAAMISKGSEGSVGRSMTPTISFLIIGVLLAVIGSSRFWFGVEYSEALGAREPISLLGMDIPLWPYEVDPRGIAMPGMLMTWLGTLVLPSAACFIGLGLVGNAKKVAPPLIGMIASAAVFVLGLWIRNWSDESFTAIAPWANMVRTLALISALVSLGLLFGFIAWLSRACLKWGGDWAKPIGALTACCAILCLAGATEMAQTLVPAPFFVFLIVGVVSAIFMNQTIYGRYLLALGRNEQAARFSGIKTDRMVILAYVICAGCAGLGGILFALDLNSIQPAQHGNFYELYAIAAAVLGGCSLRGGEGTILGVIIGAAVMRVLRNSIFLVGIPDQLEFAIIGGVILVGVIVDEVVRRMSVTQRARHEAETAESG